MTIEYGANLIMEVVSKLTAMAAVLIPLAMAVIEDLKSILNVKGQKARLLAKAVSLVFGAMALIVFFYPQWTVYVSAVIFLLIMFAAPSGGFELLERFAGAKPESEDETG